MALNGIDDADAIVVGQLLLLPAGNRMPAQAAATETSLRTRRGYPTEAQEPPAVEVDARYAGDATTDVHVVQAGESLSEIAQGYAWTWTS